jgi:hypothetical protein
MELLKEMEGKVKVLKFIFLILLLRFWNVSKTRMATVSFKADRKS